ncbi:hypothetical protein KFU94_10590 [Chloroflexi bacterium TSY]|nr:hypothetical protein [Chloroflexi bacterium TSY]
MIRYLVSATDKVSLQEIHASATTVLDETEEIVAILAQQWLEEGEAIGIQKGEAAIRDTIQRILLKRFGSLPKTVEKAIEKADFECLEQLVDVALDTFGIDKFQTELLIVTKSEPSTESDRSNAG